jgi:hypothetical protein
MLKAFAMSIYNTTQLGWTFGCSNTIASQTPFIATQNWWVDKWAENILWY